MAPSFKDLDVLVQVRTCGSGPSKVLNLNLRWGSALLHLPGPAHGVRFRSEPQTVASIVVRDPTPWMHHLFLRHETGWILQVLDPARISYYDTKNMPRLIHRLLYDRSPRCWCIGLSLPCVSKVVIDSVDNINYRLFETDMIV